MLKKRFAREVPPPPPISDDAAAAMPPAPAEPELEIQEIQGNIVPGFNKDFQTLLFLKITDVERCRAWLKSLIPFISTSEQVLAFNRLFKALRSTQGETGSLKTVWVNIAFSFAALKQLTNDADRFKDAAFKAGLQAQAAGLGDPVSDPAAEGNPSNWLVGNVEHPADIVLIVAGDDHFSMLNMVSWIETSLFGPKPSGSAGLQIVFRQEGAVLPAPLTGHEHFGFLDGISQPGVRGRVSADPRDVLTPRQNPLDPNQGKPGQDLLWPGEFIFGYSGQDPNKPVPDAGPVVDGGPAWSRNGSFLVFRRLRQDVAAFHEFLNAQAAALGVTPAKFGAMIVGRWASGAPILRAQDADNPDLGNNDCANNNFEFFAASPNPPDEDGASACAAPGEFAPSPGDQAGKILPLCGHIRKTYPRDDITPAGTGDTDEEKSDTSEQNTQTHRLLRRGIPFGRVSASTPALPVPDAEVRGLLFLAYQTSITNQFEFVTQKWVNEPDFRDGGAGFDLVIGQNSTPGEKRVRTAVVAGKTVRAVEEWVIPTGGEYLFAPSISSLQQIAGVAPFLNNALNVVVAPGSKADEICRSYAGHPSQPWRKRPPAKPTAIAARFAPDHSRDLKLQGGKTIADLVFTNFYVGGENWKDDDRNQIDAKLSAAMSDVHLNNVILQYFPGRDSITSTFRKSHVLAGNGPTTFGKSDVDKLVTSLATTGQLSGFDFSNTVFNFMLPSGTELTDDDNSNSGSASTKVPVDADGAASSLEGLGGYHGSVHVGNQIVYYAIGAFSEVLPDGRQNGIVAFDQPWKNVVATFYHELNEARTDADVEDANRTGNDKLLGWISAQGDEIGDIPIDESGGELSKVFQEVPLAGGNGTVPIQLMYSNAVGGPEGPIPNPH